MRTFTSWAEQFARQLFAGLVLILLAAGCAPSQEAEAPAGDLLLQATIDALETQVASQQDSEPASTPAQQLLATATASPAPAEVTPSATPTAVLPSATPLPVKGKVLGIEIHHCPNIDEKLAQFATEKGWVVEEIDVEPLTEAYLNQEGVSILAIQNNTMAFTEQELREIKSFVESGGGLLLQADQPRSRRGVLTFYSKEIARMFGVSISDEPIPWVDTTVQSDHPLMEGVSVFSISSSNDEREPVFLTASSPAYVVLNAGATQPYRPVLAAAEVGSGRVVIYPTMYNFAPDIRPYEAWSLGDNSYFLRNALYWLQQEKLP